MTYLFRNAKLISIEMKIKIGHDSMFNVSQINFKSAHLLHEMARGYIKSGAKKELATNFAL